MTSKRNRRRPAERPTSHNKSQQRTRQTFPNLITSRNGLRAASLRREKCKSRFRLAQPMWMWRSQGTCRSSGVAMASLSSQRPTPSIKTSSSLSSKTDSPWLVAWGTTQQRRRSCRTSRRSPSSVRTGKSVHVQSTLYNTSMRNPRSRRSWLRIQPRPITPSVTKCSWETKTLTQVPSSPLKSK